MIGNQIESKSKSYLKNHDIRVGKPSIHFPNSISLSNIEISNSGGFQNGSFLKIERIKIKFRPTQIYRILSFRNKADSDQVKTNTEKIISKIEIIRPELFLYRKESKWTIPQFGSGKKFSIPNIKVALNDGKIFIRDDAHTLDGLAIQNSSGFLNLSPNSSSLELLLETARNEKLKIEASTDLSQVIRCAIDGKNIQTGDYLQRFKIISDSYTLTGGIDSKIDLSMKWPENWSDKNSWNYNGNLRINSADNRLSFQNSTVTFNTLGNLKFSKDKIELQSFLIKTNTSQINLEGSVFLSTQTQNMQVKVTGNINWEEWAELFRSKSLNKGNIQLELSCNGALKNPEVIGTMKIRDGDFLKLPFSCETHFSYFSKAISVQTFSALWGTGKISFNGLVSPSKMNWNGKIEEFSVEKYFENNPHKIKGIASAKFNGRGTIEKPNLTGALSIKNLSFNDNKIGRFSGSFYFTRESFESTLRSPDNKNRCSLALERKNQSLILKQCAIVLRDDYLKIAGQADLKTKKINGNANASVSTNIFEPFIGFFSLFKGRLTSNSQIKGTLQDPVLEGNLKCSKLYLRGKEQDQDIGDLNSKMIWNKSSFKLANSVLSDTVQGSYEYWRKPLSMFELNYKIKNANPKILFAFMNVQTDITGMLNGSFRLIYRKFPNFASGEKMFDGEGSLSCVNGKWGETGFENLNLIYQIENSKLSVKEFSIKQKEGFLTASAESEQNQNVNPLKSNALMRNFAIGESKLNGEIHLDGNYIARPDQSLTGNVESKNFTVNGLNAGLLKGTISLVKGSLAFRNFIWGNFFEGGCEIFFGQNQKDKSPLIDGEWHSSKKDIQEWVKIFNLKEIPLSGFLNCSGKVTGSLSEPKFLFSTAIYNLNLLSKKTNESESKLKGDFSGVCTATYSKKVFQSLSLILSTKEKSRLSLLGQVNLKTHDLSFETSFKELDTDFLLQYFKWKNFKSLASGNLTVHGDWKMPEIKGEMKGTEGMIGTIPMESWEMSGLFKGNEIFLNRLNILGRKSSWRFSVLEDSWIKPSRENKSGIYRLVLDFANISLGPIAMVGDGVAEGKWSPDGQTDLISYQVNLKTNDLLINNFEIKPTKLRAQFSNKKLKLLPILINPAEKGTPEPMVTGSIDFSKLPSVFFDQLSISESQKKIFSINGEFSLNHPSFKTEGFGIDAALISNLLQNPLNVEGKSDFKAEGLMRNDRPFIKGECTVKNGKVEKIPFDDLQINFKLADNLLTISPLQIKSKNYFNVTANGTYPVKWGKSEPANGKINLKVQCSNGNLAFLNFLEIDWLENVKGPFSAQLQIQGRTENPSLDGNLKLNECEFDSRYLQKRAKNFNLQSQIKSNRFQIQKCEGTVGNGKFKMEGSVNGSFEQGEFSFDNFNLKALTLDKSGIPIQVSELPAVKEKLGFPAVPSKSAPQFSIQLQGKKESPKCSGWIQLDNALFSYPPPEKSQRGRSWLDNVAWNLDLMTGNQTIFQNEFAYAQIHGELKFEGARDNLLIKGKINSEEGSITFFGSKFELREAVLEVTQPQTFTLSQGTVTTSEPSNIAYLSLKAENNTYTTSPQGDRIPDVITLQLERTPLTEKFDTKKLIFRSSQNPNLSSEKVATIAGMGINLETATPEEKDIQMRQGVARLLDSQLASPLAHMILQRTGLVHRIEITQETPAERTQIPLGTQPTLLDSLIGQSILVERTFGAKLGVGYKATFDKIGDRADLINQVQLRYPFFKGMWLYGSRELQSKETLGREPESKAGIETRIKFDVSDLFKKSKKKEGKEK